MSNEVSPKNRTRFIQLGIAIAATRKLQNLSQEQLAEKAGISCSHLSPIEAQELQNHSHLKCYTI